MKPCHSIHGHVNMFVVAIAAIVTRSRKGNSVGKFSLSKMACVVFLFCAATAIAAPAQTFTTLFRFDGTNGSTPTAGLVQGTNGNFYGTTSGGGAKGYGTVFEITAGGKLTTLHNFCSQPQCPDGSLPSAGLVQGTNGNFYGTTSNGGANGDGTVFEITAGGKLTTLHSFDGTDGADPFAGLAQAADGNFYGTTELGGSGHSGPCNADCGTVFKIFQQNGIWTLTTLHSFDGTDGAHPYAGLVQGTNGNFYGTTSNGGANGDGTVFEITAGGKLTTLHNFCSQPQCPDGAYPYAGLVRATNGDFYGTTSGGGAKGCEGFPVECGTVFEITPAGMLTTLHIFSCSSVDFCPDGSAPNGGLVQATNGNFYGTTLRGGDNDCIERGFEVGCGTVFEITPAGTLTTLHIFDGTDGSAPYGGVVQATNGDFYGTTSGVGDEDLLMQYGTVFSLSMGLGPFVKTLPTSDKVGAKVIILGTDLTGASSVSFNGTGATFKVVSSTEITTEVPTRATTGSVEVVTPRGRLESNVPFSVP